MSLWTILLLLAATFYGPVLYAAIGGLGVYLIGGLTQRSDLGCIGAMLTGLSGLPVVLAMVGVEQGLRFCGVSLGWASLAVGAGGLWGAVHHVRRRYIASAALVFGDCLWLVWKLSAWVSS